MHRLLIGITIAVTVYVSILIPLSRGQDSSNTTVTTNTTGDDSGDRSGDSGDGDRAAPAANGTSGATNSSKSGNSTDETPKSSAWVTSANVNSPSTWFCNSTATTWPAGTINCFSSPDINMMFKSCKADKGGVTEICVCTEVSFKDPAGAAQNSLTGSNGKPIGIEFPVSMASTTCTQSGACDGCGAAGAAGAAKKANNTAILTCPLAPTLVFGLSLAALVY